MTAPVRSPFRRMRERLISGKQRVEFGFPTSLPAEAAGSMCTEKSSIPGLLACCSGLHDSYAQSTIVLFACGCTLEAAARALSGAMVAKCCGDAKRLFPRPKFRTKGRQ